MLFLTSTWRQHEISLRSMKWNSIPCLCPGGHLALRGQCDGAVAVAERPGPGQFLHPLPHSSGGPAGDRLPGSELQTHSGHQLSWDSSLTAVALIGCLPSMQVAEMLHTKLIHGGWMMKMEIKPDREIRILKAHTFYFKCGDKLSCNWFLCSCLHNSERRLEHTFRQVSQGIAHQSWELSRQTGKTEGFLSLDTYADAVKSIE